MSQRRACCHRAPVAYSRRRGRDARAAVTTWPRPECVAETKAQARSTRSPGTPTSPPAPFAPLIDQGLRTRVARMREIGLEDPLLPDADRAAGIEDQPELGAGIEVGIFELHLDGKQHLAGIARRSRRPGSRRGAAPAIGPRRRPGWTTPDQSNSGGSPASPGDFQ